MGLGSAGACGDARDAVRSSHGTMKKARLSIIAREYCFEVEGWAPMRGVLLGTQREEAAVGSKENAFLGHGKAKKKVTAGLQKSGHGGSVVRSGNAGPLDRDVSGGSAVVG